MQQREVQAVVISDVHLGTYGCHASELLTYLKSIDPGILVINGDFFDGWAFSKRYFPPSHFAVIQYIVKLISMGKKVIYITGNHDDFLRKYSDVSLGNFKIVDKIVIEINNKKYWIFHGDVFDRSTRGYAKWLALLGGKAYDWLIRFNRLINFVAEKFGQEKYSLSKKVKQSIKKAVSYISDFEETAIELAIRNGYDGVICGHIHQPQHRTVTTPEGNTEYLNSGDWVENLTALEYHNNQWKIYEHSQASKVKPPLEPKKELNVMIHDSEEWIREPSIQFLKFYLQNYSI